MTTPNDNDIKGAPNGDDYDAKFDPRPKWPFWIGISGRFRRNAQVERRYWDSACFLAWLQDEVGRADLCRDVFALAERGEVEIVTSTLTLSEVLHLRPKDAIPAERRAAVESLFNRPHIQTMMLTRRLAERSREVVWGHGVRPKDAIHVASALAAKAAVLNTFDGPLIGKSGQVGTPPLLIKEPTITEPELDLEQPEDEGPA